MCQFKRESVVEHWNELLNDQQRWQYLAGNPFELTGLMVVLDNDQTIVCFNGANESDVEYTDKLTQFHSWVGNSPGVVDLLIALNIKCEFC